MDADGSNQTRLTNNLVEDKALHWSPNNTDLIFTRLERTADSEMYVVNVNTAVVTRLTNNTSNEFAPRWSPDGSLIAFSTNRHRPLRDLCHERRRHKSGQPDSGGRGRLHTHVVSG